MAAELFPKRADTSSTIGTDDLSKENERSVKRQSTVAARTQAQTQRRRLTLSHRKLVFCDPVAFRYLEEDESTIVLARRERLVGYELYFVEQWVCSRVHPTFVIATYTGDSSHSILVNVLAIPHDEKNWSRRLKIYFDAVSQFHAREMDTSLGTLMVTNLSAFPSGLTVIGVPDGDVKKHREDFIVNENLKRMGCTGRAAMNLRPAAQSARAKFHHLYRTSENIPFQTSVVELVKVCQTALVLYGKLNSSYVDGLLCDITEKAIAEWWNDIGTEFHNIEPSDGILGPTTVSALVGLMIGAYNRIRASGIYTPKDVLDVIPMKRAVGQFQKVSKIKRTRRLDRDTLDRLHRATAKTANNEGWAVPRAVKSTVAELSGKGGEMVMGAIGANKEKVGISEVETLDIDKLAQLVPGAKMRWLWQGKPLKSSRNDVFGTKADDGLNGRVFSTDEQGNYLWTSEVRGSLADNEDGDDVGIHDRSGLKKLRGGIPGLRSHGTRSHKYTEEQSEKEDNSAEPKVSRWSKDYTKPDHVLKSSSSFLGRSSLERELNDKPSLDLSLAYADAEAPTTPLLERPHSKLQAVQNTSENEKSVLPEQLRAANQKGLAATGRKRVRSELRRYRAQMQAEEYQNFATEFEEQVPESHTLRRSRSALQLREIESPVAHYLRLPRQLSFSLVEASVLKFPTPQDDLGQTASTEQDKDVSSSKKMLNHVARGEELSRIMSRLLRIEQNLLLDAENEVVQVEALDAESQEHLSELNSIYYQRLDEYQSLQGTSRDMVAREKASLNDGLRKIEMLGQKLDYELDALHSRMQEVEDGAADFERNVAEIEARVSELVREKQSKVVEQVDHMEDKAIPWVQRVINFFGS